MDHKQANQIAELINVRNRLARQYNAQDILDAADRYLFELSVAGDVVGCVEIKRVQWYQFEIDHLSVVKDVEGKGIGWKLFKRAEERALSGRGRVLQCTIREDNAGSERLFKRNGFHRAAEFYYPDTGNNVGVWQKVISLTSRQTV
jgi:GNAT superfamily N-acetyltransferase